MDFDGITDVLKKKFGEGVILDLQEEGSSPPAFFVEAERICEVVSFLKEEETLSFDSLMCLSGADYEDRMEVVYHLHSMRHLHKITVKVRIEKAIPTLPSIAAIYGVANYHEREAYDLFGIIFTGHPDLRRILLPDDWPGHPLRKDYTYPDSYHGVKV